MHGDYKRLLSSGDDKPQLQKQGIVFPIHGIPLKFLPGRHLLGRAGDGMRFLRSRPFQPLDDNPRDIDKFSPRHSLTVSEWEHEAQTEILILCDVSGSMAYPAKHSLRNAVIQQLIYSIWRAGDKVCVSLFADGIMNEIREANLRNQIESFNEAVSRPLLMQKTDISKVLKYCQAKYDNGAAGLIFLVSDFLFSDEHKNHVLPLSMVRRFQGDFISIIISFRLDERAGGVGKLWDPERNRYGMVMLSSGRCAHINQVERQRVQRAVRNLRDVQVDSVSIDSSRQIFPLLSNLARNRDRRR